MGIIGFLSCTNSIDLHWSLPEETSIDDRKSTTPEDKTSLNKGHEKKQGDSCYGSSHIPKLSWEPQCISNSNPPFWCFHFAKFHFQPFSILNSDMFSLSLWYHLLFALSSLISVHMLFTFDSSSLLHPFWYLDSDRFKDLVCSSLVFLISISNLFSSNSLFWNHTELVHSTNLVYKLLYHFEYNI